ncbi:MAG TPA: folylpolyglutamate synthase/dihydrofolate synthase family protein [Candidatus Polarisedimenticolia bacterium]|nr:folylpolyglutamate synthase/dihydrofolate synthase family protein [Candidatus Polarisedimenticolia bacterium]
MTYREALAFLASLESLGIRPGLDRIRALLARLRDPQDRFQSTLIAGTNGKGSIAAYLASILSAAGVSAGVYTSPHLVRFEERIAIGGELISEDEVASLTCEVRQAIEAERAAGGDPPTYFEATTALAFLQFARRGVPLAVLEVGMGGRFDATNVVTPLACAIAPVAMDHMQWLGATLSEIAWQKAGILKPGIPCAVSRQDKAALDVIRGEAARLAAPLILSTECAVRPGGRGPGFPDPPVFSLTTPSGACYDDLTLALRGAHQVDNATTAVLVAERLAARGFPSIDRTAITRGLFRAVWPGRIEILPGRPDLLLDGAHNPAGCETLAAYLRQHQAGRRVTLVFGAMKDKPADVMLGILCPLASRVIVTSIPVPRGESPHILQRYAAHHHRDVVIEPSIADALEAARQAAGADGLCVVSGSLYLVGEVKRRRG